MLSLQRNFIMSAKKITYILEGKLESIKYSSDAKETKVSEIKITPVGEYTLNVKCKKYCIMFKDNQIDAKILEFNEHIFLSINETYNFLSLNLGKIIAVEFSIGSGYLLKSDKSSNSKPADESSTSEPADKSMTIKIENIEIFA